MYFEPSSIRNMSLMKLWNTPSALNNSGQNVEESQYGHTSIAFAEYCDNIKCLIFFGIKYTGGTSQLFSFDQCTENAFTPSESGHMYLELSLWVFLLVWEANLSTDTLAHLFVNIFTKSFVINQSS